MEHTKLGLCFVDNTIHKYFKKKITIAMFWHSVTSCYRMYVIFSENN